MPVWLLPNPGPPVSEALAQQLRPVWRTLPFCGQILAGRVAPIMANMMVRPAFLTYLTYLWYILHTSPVSQIHIGMYLGVSKNFLLLLLAMKQRIESMSTCQQNLCDEHGCNMTI